MPVEATPVASYTGYVTQDQLIKKYGTKNIRIWSRKDGAASIDPDAVDLAIEEATSQINDTLAQRYTIPLSSSCTEVAVPSAKDLSTLKRWGLAIAAYQLYIARGLDVEENPDGNVLKTDRDEAIAEVKLFATLGSAMRLDACIPDSASVTHEFRAEVVYPLKDNPYWRNGW